ncbi:MAG: DNA/RNA helicase domain-containing protein [Candidatus Aminicenantales bacterium]
MQFKYFNSYVASNPDAVDVLICDEAHRLRETSQNRYTAKAERSDVPQIQELISAARVSVFLIDQDQVVRPEEVGSVSRIKEFAEKNDSLVFEHELETQFRCGGSEAFVSWVNNTLGIARTPNVLWTGEEGFEFKIFDSPESLERAIRKKALEGASARMTAGFCWEWSKHAPGRDLDNDVVVGEFRRPWNARHDAIKLPKNVPKAQFWAHDPHGIDQIGCVYTAQGFEFDYIGVIFGNDIIYSFTDGAWTGHPENSGDHVVRRAKGKFVDLVKNTYRVLLSRGLKGCYVYFLNPDTEKFFRSRMDVKGAATLAARTAEVEPYMNSLPLVGLGDMENLTQSDWRTRLERGWAGEFLRIAGGPFLRDRYLVRIADASMEPLISKEALCEFRVPSGESLENKVVLAGLKTYAKRTPGVVVRRYQRLAVIRAGEIAETTKIFLATENKAFPALELREGADSVEILGVFERVV